MLKRLNNQEFINKLKSRKLENLVIINQIEKLLKKQRGYVFRMPKKGSPVILLLSGGLDSVISWGILMKEFGLHVYPISFDKGEKRALKEKSAINYFSEYYKEKYPGLYHEPIRLAFGLGDIKIPVEKRLKMIHPEVIINNFRANEELADINVSLGSFLLLPVYAKIYAEYLNITQNLNVYSIFCSVITSDGLLLPHQTFTSLRTMMLYLCTTASNKSWQFTSAVFEKESGLYLDKADLIKWASENKIPLEKTWSCYFAEKYQCGGTDCLTCIVRREAFSQAGIKDLTKYRPVASQSVFGFFKYKLNRLIDKFSKLYYDDIEGVR